MKATVVNINNSEYDVYIGRAGCGMDGYFGNPFSTKATDPRFKVICRTEAIDKHRAYTLRRFNIDPTFRAKILLLKGKRLGCFCKPRACHGDIYAELVNSYYSPLFT